MKDHRLGLVHVVQQEHALAEAGKRLRHGAAVERSAARACAFQAIEHAVLVALGLQPANEPGPGIGQPLVVEIDRVLGRQHQPQPVGPRLLEQRQEQRFGRRIGGRRHVTEQLVHVEHGPQARCARLGAHPGDDLAEQQRDEEHALRVREMRDRQHRNARPTFIGIEQRACGQRLALHPGRETRRSEQVVELHGQREAILGGKHGFQVHHPDTLDRRRLDRADQARQVERAPCLPAVLQDIGDEDVFAAGQRIGIDTQQGENRDRGRLDPLGKGFRVVA